MNEKITIQQAVVVEGNYDKVALERFVDALIVPTHGFSIFTDTETKNLLRRLAAERGLVLLTDSDAAGFRIRGFLKGIIPPEQITDVYIPDIFGKERRKSQPSKEGMLGVEGMSREVLVQAFSQAGVLSDESTPVPHITKTDLYKDGFTGREHSAQRRQQLYQRLGLPRHLSVKQAVPLLCSMLTREEYDALCGEIEEKNNA